MSIDGGEWLTYAEAGKRLGISAAAARQLSRRRGWQRRTPNAYGVQAQILVPEEALEQPLQGNTDGDRTGHNERDTSAAAFALLARQLEREQDRADRAERLLEVERQRVEAGHQRITDLLTELADARGAERISADSAAALRHELDMLRARPWWRRWFRGRSPGLW
jgi:hypothetical protein